MSKPSAYTLRDALQQHGHKVLPSMEAIRELLRGRQSQSSVAMSACLMVAAEAALDGSMTADGFVQAARMAFDSQVAAAALLRQQDSALS